MAQEISMEGMKMEAGKYISPLGGEHQHSQATSGKKWKGLKGQAALALTVSLWIVTGGVVSSAAGSFYLNVDNSNMLYQYGTPPIEATISSFGKTLFIAGGNWNNDS